VLSNWALAEVSGNMDDLGSCPVLLIFSSIRRAGRKGELVAAPGATLKGGSMKRTLPGALAAIACAATIGLSAQTPPAGGQTPPASGAQTPSTSASSQSANKVTVTGCLEKASGSAASPTGTSGAAGASSSAKFVLNNVSSGGSSSSTAGTAGTAGASSSSSKSMASSYQLDGEDSKLSPHVGHKVEISGTVDKSGSSASTSASSAAKLKVDSVKMIASSCTQ
jgi:hypothetical protein